MPIKSSETRPQQGRGQTTKTKCPCCRTYIQAEYMKINGKLVSVGEECPVCYDEKRKNEFNKDELEAILETIKHSIDTLTFPAFNGGLYELLERVCEKSEKRLKYME